MFESAGSLAQTSGISLAVQSRRVMGPSRLGLAQRIVFVVLCCTLLTGVAFAATTTARPVFALRVIDALSTPTSLTVRGTITNSFLAGGDATCATGSFALMVGGTAYQGAVHCDDAAIAPGAKTHFDVTFPPVTMGVYYLRYQKTAVPPQYDVIPLRLRMKAGS
jgi:hypothetical protein